MGEAVRQVPAVTEAPWIRGLAPTIRFVFHGGAAARAAAQTAWGVAFSEAPCRANTIATRATLWLGPDEYLLLEFGPGAPTLFDALEQSLAGVPHSLVDIGHRQFAFELRGPHAAAILSGACPLDLDLAEFPVGMCTRTVLAKADIVLWRTGERTFHVEVWRSFAGYALGVLQEIAGEFHPPAPGKVS